MEERIIDDEYARGIRLKKTKEGYVDVTDELAEEERKKSEEAAEPETDIESHELGATAEEEAEAGGEPEEALIVDALKDTIESLSEEEGGEEVTFEFPDLEEDDEDLVNLTPEEAIALRRKKEAEEAERKATYKRLCEEGEELLVSGSFKAAELKFEKALVLAEEDSDAAVGYWRARTSDFAHPEVLAGEYLETGFESLENDLGDDATGRIKALYKDVFAARVAELTQEETPLAQEVAKKQEKRRAILKKRISSSKKSFILTALPTLVSLVLTVVFGLRITTRPDGLFVWLTIVCGVLFAACFVAFAIFTNRFVNALRMNRANEDLSSTEEGEKLLEIRAYKELYAHFAE